MQIKSR
jgi:hypothetical protein